MSEQNGDFNPLLGMSLRERLELPEASHVVLMTEREVRNRKQDRAWRRNRNAWAQMRASEERYRAAQRVRDTDMDKSTTDLPITVQ
jgi:hypothetical protein